MKRGFLTAAVLTAGLFAAGPSAALAEDLAWKYEGTPAADVVSVGTAESPALSVQAATGVAGSETEIDARWSCEQFLANLTYRFKKFFAIILR